MHPGDMRVLTAVGEKQVPVLADAWKRGLLENVLVLPAPLEGEPEGASSLAHGRNSRHTQVQNGEAEILRSISAVEQPLAQQMSGSDLDGDLYNVTWEPLLIEDMKRRDPWNEEPINYVQLEAEVKEGKREGVEAVRQKCGRRLCRTECHCQFN